MPQSIHPLAQSVLDSLSAHIAILDEAGRVLETNQAWREFAWSNGMPPDYHGRGDHYLAVCDAVQGPDAGDAHRVAAGIREVLGGRCAEFRHDYPCHTPQGPHWYYMRAILMRGAKPPRVVVSHEDITALKLTEEALRRSREELDDQKQSLEEANIALKVLLKQREADRSELERRVLNNVKDLVFPYIEKLKGAALGRKERTLVEIVETHLKDVVSPFRQRLSNVDTLLTPQELQVAALIRDGRPSKAIAGLLNISEATVNFHRQNLRRKFELTNRGVNLRAYLLSLAD
jgi:DNA-binding CsgD family transcriptional regulator